MAPSLGRGDSVFIAVAGVCFTHVTFGTQDPLCHLPHDPDSELIRSQGDVLG